MVASSIHYNSQKTKEEFNEKIEDLNLIALRKYACPKVSSQKDWYMNCLECKGGCSVGKRVADILDKETEPLDSIFEKAIKERDPINWLLQKGYYTSKGSAINNLNRWKREQGNKKQLSKTEEPKKPISQDEKFEMALKQPDPYAWLFEQGYYKDRKIARDKLNMWKKKKQESGFTVPYVNISGNKKKTEIMKLLEGDPDLNTLAFRFLNASKQKTKIISVATNMSKWIRNNNFKSIPGIEKFGKVSKLLYLDRYAGMTVSEFLAKYEGQDLMALHNQALLEAKSKRAATLKHVQHIPKHVSQPKLAESPTENEEEDEVSVEDFLTELEDNFVLEEEKTEPEPEPEPEPKDTNSISESSDPLLESFKAKYKVFSSKLDTLSKEFKETESHIQKLKHEFAETESQMEKLKEAAKLLGYIL